MGITIGKDNKLSVDKDTFMKADVDKVKELLIEIINGEIERKRAEEREKELEEERRLEEEFEGNAKRTFDEWWKEKEKTRASIIEKIKKQ